VLQPLVENAIQHGIAPSPAGGRVWIRAHHEQDTNVILIGNTIAGKAANGTQTAGNEARARLRNAFGERASMTTNRTDCEFEIRITLPRWANGSRGEA